ncbi:MAG: type I-E CRISPR-associated protein Cas7/Cse4/CasC [Chloroflexi bacterium]|nr:type I-E CRISPR-associated protein Cas7/Cse4/CasC [Chloroflexota bacterium]
MNLAEIHILQPVPPANLNRDDTGSPKDAVFGGARRARISSQAQKRAVRRYFADLALLGPEDRAVRTRLLVDRELVPRFRDRSPEETRAVVMAALRGLGLTVDQTQENRTEYLLFLGRREIDRLAEVIERHWDALRSVTAPTATGKQKKHQARTGVSGEVQRALEAVLNGGKAVDLALFGRMLADRPEWSVDAACQVAHAISTHRVDREFDFYTAVDELSPREQTGAGMVGDVEYYAATFYRYANVNLDLLLQNLQGDRDLAARAVEAFLRAFILTLPSGKQNTFAAHSPPQFWGILVRKDSMPRNLAAAFESPVYPRDGKSLTGASVEALTKYWKQLDEVYGKPAQEWAAMVNLSDGELQYQEASQKSNLEEAMQTAMEGVRSILGA